MSPEDPQETQPLLRPPEARLGPRVALAGRAGLCAPHPHAAAHVLHARNPTFSPHSTPVPGGHGCLALPVGL
uniref:Intestinal GLUT8 transporter MSP3 n=1 Tax=Mus musculus TaxID=10090 RepID=Q2TK25_MOUSE|nr:intestinal GLUT8 transporter MSP3 [Mus musculus]